MGDHTVCIGATEKASPAIGTGSPPPALCKIRGSFAYGSDGMKSGVPSWYVLEAQIIHPEEDTPCRPT
ncbi:hypothetical protein HDF15_005172, partial [Granulicella mallensis]|nr:hypothetical protein [Granulicella mallensis]